MTDHVLIGALALAVATALAAIFAGLRARAHADQRVADAVRKLADGMQDTMRDLAAAYEQQAAAPSEPPTVELAASPCDRELCRQLECASSGEDGIERKGAAVSPLDA